MQEDSYKTFMAKIPANTKSLIAKAMEIYSELANSEIWGPAWRNGYNMEYSYLSNDDKAVISLFLAIAKDGFYNEALKPITGLTAKDVYQYLSVQDISPIELLFDDYERYYHERFKRILYKIIDRIETDKHKGPELLTFIEIFKACFDKFSCQSDVISWIYRSQKEEDFNYSEFIERLKDLNTEYRQKGDFKSSEEERPKEAMGTGENSPKSNKKKLPKSYMDGLAENMNAREYVNNPAVGREQELKNLELALLTSETSAIIVGGAGTGKTALVEGLAYQIKMGNVPKMLKDKQIVKVDVNSLVAGTMYRGQFEEKVENVLKWAASNPNIIIFFDEIHMVIGAGNSMNSNLGLANILKPYLDRGKVKIIGATTEEEYEKFIMSDEAFKRRFERVDVKEPNDKMVAEILRDIIPKLEKVTGVVFPYSVDDTLYLTKFIAEATSSKNRNYKDRVNNPDLAIKIFSKAFALASYEGSNTVSVEHLAEIIRRSTRLNEASRERLANILVTKFVKNEMPNMGCRIIEFPRK